MNEVRGVGIAEEREAQSAGADHEPLRASGVLREAGKDAATEIMSFDPAPAMSKPPIEPANAAGSLSASSPPLRHVCVMVEVAPEVILKSPCA